MESKGENAAERHAFPHAGSSLERRLRSLTSHWLRSTHDSGTPGDEGGGAGTSPPSSRRIRLLSAAVSSSIRRKAFSSAKRRR